MKRLSATLFKKIRNNLFDADCLKSWINIPFFQIPSVHLIFFLRPLDTRCDGNLKLRPNKAEDGVEVVAPSPKTRGKKGSMTEPMR